MPAGDASEFATVNLVTVTIGPAAETLSCAQVRHVCECVRMCLRRWVCSTSYRERIGWDDIDVQYVRCV
jgi:hypothetical protein